MILSHYRRGRFHDKWIDPFFVFFGPWFETNILALKGKKRTNGVRATLLRMHNNAVHTRRICDRKKKKTGRVRVHFKRITLHFYIFGNQGSTPTFRLSMNFWRTNSAVSWSKLGPFILFDPITREGNIFHGEWISSLFSSWFDPNILTPHGFWE